MTSRRGSGPRQEHAHHERGFTLVELLVVIAIIGLLVGLLLPAVQAARESSRRSACASKVKQIAVGCHLHLDARRVFPVGQRHQVSTINSGTYFSCGDGNAPAGFNPWFSDARSFITVLLPFMEHASDYDRLDFTKSASVSPNTTVLQNCFPFARCPTNPQWDKGYGGWNGMAHYGGSFGTVGNPCWRQPVPNGMFYGVPADDSPGGITVREVTDGLNNTIMVCEKLGYTPLDPVSGSPGFRECSFDAGAPRPPWWNVYGNNRGAVVRMDQGPNRAVVSTVVTVAPVTPYSFHPGGLHVAFGDGAVQFISETTDTNVWNALSARNDGSTRKYNP